MKLPPKDRFQHGLKGAGDPEDLSGYQVIISILMIWFVIVGAIGVIILMIRYLS